jgi:hypothetical protein
MLDGRGNMRQFAVNTLRRTMTDRLSDIGDLLFINDKVPSLRRFVSLASRFCAFVPLDEISNS